MYQPLIFMKEKIFQKKSQLQLMLLCKPMIRSTENDLDEISKRIIDTVSKKLALQLGPNVREKNT